MGVRVGTLTPIAEAIGVSVHHLDRICTGKLQPTAEEKAAISELLQIDQAQVFDQWGHLSAEDAGIERLCDFLHTPGGKLWYRQLQGALCEQ
jgi:hypothetical protein